MVKQRKLSMEEWFEKLILNVLPYEVWLQCSNEECAYLVLLRYERSPERSWGWSWGSWLSCIFDGCEFYNSLTYEEKQRIDRKLLEHVERLADKVPEERKYELDKIRW